MEKHVIEKAQLVISKLPEPKLDKSKKERE